MTLEWPTCLLVKVALPSLMKENRANLGTVWVRLHSCLPSPFSFPFNRSKVVLAFFLFEWSLLWGLFSFLFLCFLSFLLSFCFSFCFGIQFCLIFLLILFNLCLPFEALFPFLNLFHLCAFRLSLSLFPSISIPTPCSVNHIPKLANFFRQKKKF